LFSSPSFSGRKAIITLLATFPPEGLSGLKNLHTRLFLLILVLAGVSIYVLARYPTHYGLDVQGGLRVVLRAQIDKLSTEERKNWDQEHLESVVNIVDRRVNTFGVSEPVVYGKPADNQIIVELPGLKNQDEALKIIQNTAKLEFRQVTQLDDGTWSTRDASTKGSDQDPGYEEIITREGKPVPPEQLQEMIFSKPALLDGSKLKPNSRADLGTGQTVIHFEFKDDSKEIFKDFTASHQGKRLAIFLDQKLLSAPVIEDVIPGIGIIRGNFTPESAKTLADQLNAGALPVPLQIDAMTKVEPTLGKAAVQQTMIAGIVGLGLVLAIMIFWYKGPGVIANFALLLYALFTFAIFKSGAFVMPPITLTVPGLAGFILSIGMAVDANILIFERMKEERSSGKSLRASIETGFKRAFSAIADSNICTLITCYILYQLGTGQVRGFAVTLAIGVLVSMFTAITCTRTFLLLLAGTQYGQNDKIYALHGGMHPKLNVTKRMNFWFAVSGLLILPGLIAWGLGGIKKSIEFTGGTEFTAVFNQAPDSAKIMQTLSGIGHKESRILVAEGNRAYITTSSVAEPDRPKVEQAIQSLGARVEGVSTVSGAISKELTSNAIWAVIFASGLIIVYLAFRFSIPNLMEGLKFGISAVLALLHDVLVVWGAFAIFGLAMNWQIDSLFVTAMLTVIGFSVHDSIIIFDRIRENLRHRQRGETFAEVADRSIEQTFARSVRTSGTVVLTLMALLLLGGPTVRGFVTALLIGIVSGTYSSIFNATPILVLLKGRSAEALPATAGSGAALRTTPRPTPRVTPKPVPATGPKVDGTAGNGRSSEAASVEGDEADRQTKIQARKRKRRM
jgi:SecD/SecF fusion protein